MLCLSAIRLSVEHTFLNVDELKCHSEERSCCIYGIPPTYCWLPCRIAQTQNALKVLEVRFGFTWLYMHDIYTLSPCDVYKMIC